LKLSSDPVDAAQSAAVLRVVALPERVGERGAHRLAEVQEAFAADLAALDAALGAVVRDGPAPAALAATHLAAAGGKRVRPLLVLLSAACFGGGGAVARELALAAELVHLATLLHDDVVDDGDERRGVPAARRIYGNAVSVLAGDLLLTHALERTAAAAPAVLPDLLRTLRRLVDGEVVQLRGRVELDLDERTHAAIVRDKTASLFAWAARAGARAAGAPEDAVQALGAFGEHVGLAFQLVDDALDYAGDARETGKSLLADVHEGKITLPLLRALALRPQLAAELQAVRAGDGAAALRVAQSVRESGACAAVRDEARAHTREAIAALACVPEGRARELLAAVAEELTVRRA
jgi:octaprenyl-diphosphate synthase